MKNYRLIMSVLATLMSSILGHNVTAQETHFSKEAISKKATTQSYSTIHKPSIMIVGIECRTSNAREAGPQDIPKHWERFFKENTLSQIANKSSEEIIALYCDYEGDHTQPYSLVIGCQVDSIDNIPKGMVSKIIPASSYAIFHAIGEQPQAIIKTWEHIWEHSDLKRTYTGDYELYGDRFFSKSPKEVDVYIAIENPE